MAMVQLASLLASNVACQGKVHVDAAPFAQCPAHMTLIKALLVLLSLVSLPWSLRGCVTCAMHAHY
jgi:hypothetical protein